MSKRKFESSNTMDNLHKKIKLNPKIREPAPMSFEELPGDIHDYIINFLGASSLLNLAITCSKLTSAINCQYKKIARNLFPCRLDATSGVLEQIQNELKDLAQIEKTFDYHKVRVIEVDENDAQLVKRTLFKHFPSDPTKLLCLTNGNKLAQLIDMALGNIYSIDMKGEVHDAAVSQDNHVAVLSKQGVVQIYSVSNPAHWVQVCTFDTNIHEAKIKWMTVHRYWIVYAETTSHYQVFDSRGNLIKKVQYNDNGTIDRLLAVSDDGSDAVRLMYRQHNRGTFSRVDLLTDQTTCLIADTGEADSGYIDLQFLTGTDWVAWRRQFDMLLMYNLNTGESFSTIPEVEIDNYWKLSPSGTMLLEALTGSRSIVIYDLYGDCFQLQFQDVIMSASWTYQLQEDGAMKEHIVACLMREETTAIVLIEPITGEVVATVYEGDQVCWSLVEVLAQGRTLVFHANLGYFMVWNLH